MSERLSRFAVGIEALLFALPVTALAGFAFFAGLVLLGSPTQQIYEQAQTIVYVLPIVPLAAGWILIGRFVMFGSPALRSSSNLLWLAAYLGAAIVVCALVVGLWTRSSSFGDAASLWAWVRSYFRELAFGLPALLPLAHLAIERRFRTSPKNAWSGHAS